MAGSEYYGDITVGGRSLNDATPSEWDQAYENTKLSVDDITYVGDEANINFDAETNKTFFVKTSPDPDNVPPLFTSWNDPMFKCWNEYTDDIDYKFRERELIEEFRKYIDTTYSGHYGQGGLQSSEVIVDRGHGMGFFAGNIDKYNGRYGNKGENPADWRKDIMKTIHYGFLKLFEHDRIHGNNGNTTD